MMKIENLFRLPSELVEGKEKFETILKTGNFYVERIISKGNCPSDELMIQDWTELVFLLKGYAELELDNKEIIKLNEGDYILIPKQLPHRVLKTDDFETIWLAIHYEES